MRRAALGLLAAACGCNGLLGLTEVEAERDIDRDGIPSGDNCPSVSNPEQLDQDADGVGDACDACDEVDTQTGTDADRDGLDDGCDPCAAGPQIDEDLDGVYDACDLCPHVADPAQADKDGDKVGDACDGQPASPTQHAVFFDGFAPPDPRWQAFGIPTWTPIAGAVEVADPTASNRTGIFASPPFELVSAYWAIDTTLDLLGLPGRAGIQLDATGSGKFFMCGVNCPTATACQRFWQTDLLKEVGPTFVPTGPLHVRVEQVRDGVTDRLVCSLPELGEIYVNYGEEQATGFSLVADTTTRFHHVFVQN